MPLWKDGKFVEDNGQVVADDAPVPANVPVVLSLKRWKAEKTTLATRNAPIGLVIEAGSAWQDIVDDLPPLPLLVITIPKKADSPPFSIPPPLREVDAYRAEISA